LENPDNEFQCSECGADVPVDANTCPNCGAHLEEISENENLTEEEFVEIPIVSDPITLSTIESLLKSNKINYSLDESIIDPVFGYSNSKISKLLIPKDKMEVVEKIFREYEGKTILNNIMDMTGGFETDKKIDAELLEEESQSQTNFKKQKGAFLSFFFIFLLFLLPLINLPFNIFYFYKISKALSWQPTVDLIFDIVLFLSTLIIIYAIYMSGLALRGSPNIVKQFNRYLNICILYSVSTLVTSISIIPFKYIQTNHSSVGLFKILIALTVFSLIVIVNLKIYLRKSQRIKDTLNIHLN